MIRHMWSGTRPAQARDAAPRWQPDDRPQVAERALYEAVAAAWDVREHDPAIVWGDLALRIRDEPDRVIALIVALAALVPIEQPIEALLAWTNELEVPA